MVELSILAGTKAGGQTVVRHFPFRIGRARENDLQLNDDGTWDQHLTLEFHRCDGFRLVVARNASVMVNNQPVQTVLLRNGDIITLGFTKLQFWLAAARQRSLRLREGFVWLLMIAVAVCQFVLIYGLVR
ncbi:MAG TPA: FHA domain-containing protein [Candidatus Saccharimonadales bacterium]|nr:FHA domain-containing protein [Candidatus Saccharimonadales bacterium]